MKPIGKTYLIQVRKHDENENVINGIIIPDNSSFNDIYYEGVVIEYGTGWNKDEIKDLVPIGKTVFFEYKKKCGTKCVLKDKIYYIQEAKNVLAIKED